MTTIPLHERARTRVGRGIERRRAAGELVESRGAVLAATGLVVIVAGSLLLVILAANRPNFLSVTTSPGFFPGWLAGPLGGLWSSFPRGNSLIKAVFTVAVALMWLGYLACIRYAPRLRARWVIGALLAVQAIFLLSPPFTQTDVFNYINYARLEVVHHLNPYTTIPVIEPHTDPAYALSNWHELLSPYGPLFTIMMFAVVPFGVAASFWLVKCLLAATCLAGLLLVWKCARLLGRDPVQAVAFAGLNPIVLLWGLGGDHNDFVMMFFLLLACYLLLRSGGGLPSRELDSAEDARPATVGAAALARLRSSMMPPAWHELAAGASLAAAVFVKASAAIVVPVILVALARSQPRRAVQTVLGGLAATIVFAALTYVAFGAHIPDLGTQGSLVTDLGVPNLLGLALGQGGETTTLRELLMVALVLAVLVGCMSVWRGRHDFITHAGWASIALLLTLAWVLPWYVVWAVPFAALSDSRRLRTATLLFGVYLIVAWVPVTSGILSSIGFSPEGTALGQLHHRYTSELLN